MDPKARVLRKKLLKSIAIGAGVLLIAGLLGATGFFYTQYQKSQQLVQNPQANLTPDDGRKIIVAVGKLVELPIGEEPTVATVTNADQLKQNNNFFQQVQNGDTILIYSKAKRAILYRSSINKVVDIAPIHFTEPTPTPVGVGKVAGVSVAPTQVLSVSPTPEVIQASDSAIFSQ